MKLKHSKSALVLTHIVTESSKTSLVTESILLFLNSLDCNVRKANTYKFPVFDFSNEKTLNVVHSQISNSQLLLIIVPTYNWNVPSGMKSWIDYAVRVDHNGKINQTLKNKVCIIINLQGSNKETKQADFVTDYLKSLMLIQGAKEVFLRKISQVTPEVLNELTLFLEDIIVK